MPLPSVSKHSAKQSVAQTKSKQQPCLNPAAYGCKTCRLHGARKQNSIKRGEEHPNYRHGMETLEAKRDRSKKLAELREYEQILIKRGLIRDHQIVGRKPKKRNCDL